MKGAKTKRKPRRNGRPARGSLFIIALFLISSAFVRIGNEAGQAFARGSEPAVVGEGEETGGETCQTAPDIQLVLDALKAREKRTREREDALEVRLKALSIADREIEKKMAQLVEAEESLRATIALADSAAEDDLSKLTEVYENMKPKDAAALFEEMAPEFAAGFLGRMRPDAAAGVMAGLTPQAAYTISVILAGRNAEVPD